MSITYHPFQTALGIAVVGLAPSGVCFLQFGESSVSLVSQLRMHCPGQTVLPAAIPQSDLLSHIESAVSAAIRGRGAALATIAIAPVGSEFQLAVWHHLRSIPPGKVQSYSAVAQALNTPRATRAVARACGANSIALFIPCHRVIRSDGSLGGFRWGLETKRRLLEAESSTYLNSPASTYQGSNVNVDIPETTSSGCR
jgi:AraC family transcriptional regulator of adaptative response/methylated-DNA-[protein]-cysteine methyltransferase